uniref:Sulfate_transp domain-containing protein n=1 Tax=Angiostrongylus cantonensis TaxID=6313 RepID=A0A0K0DPI7_ANGCA
MTRVDKSAPAPYMAHVCENMTTAADSSDENENISEGYYDRVPKNQARKLLSFLFHTNLFDSTIEHLIIEIIICIFDEEFGLLRHSSRESSAKRKLEQMRLSRKHFHPCRLLDFLPILQWLPQYDMKKNLVNDIIGGLTVGIMHVPQGMAYSSLSGLRPVNGLYTSLFPALFYMLFGTSRHVSLGEFRLDCYFFLPIVRKFFTVSKVCVTILQSYVSNNNTEAPH